MSQYLSDLQKEVSIPADGITSRALYTDDRVRVIIFGFDKGQELSEHTASVPAIIQVLSGEAELGLGDEKVIAGPGSWVHMEANLKHTVVATTPLVMLLTMLKA